MLDEWKIDTSNRIQEYNLNGPECSEKILFQMVHTLKTNFFMIGCVKMIRKCEDFIHSKHNAEIILNFGIDLNLAFEEVCELLEKTNPH